MVISRQFNMVLLVSALALAVAVAEPRSSAAQSHDGPYAGLGLAYAVVDFSGFARASHAEDGFGLNVRGGYRKSFLAAELAIEYFPSFDVPSDDNAIEDEDLAGLLVGPNLKAYPLQAGKFQPYALVGLGLSYVDGNNDYNELEFMMRFGGGIEYYFTEKLTLFAEGFYALPINRETEMIPFMGGIQFHFGGPAAGSGAVVIEE